MGFHGIPNPIYDQPSAWLNICKYNWNCTPEFLQLWLLLEKAVDNLIFPPRKRTHGMCSSQISTSHHGGSPWKTPIDILSTWLIGGGVNFIQQPIGSICQWKRYCQMKLNPSSFAVKARPPVLQAVLQTWTPLKYWAMHFHNELLMCMLMACVSWYTHMGGDSMRDCLLPDVGKLPSTPSLRLLSGCNPTDQCLNTTDRFCLIVPAAWTLMTLLSIEISVCGVEQIKQLHQTDFQKMCTNLKWAIAGD